MPQNYYFFSFSQNFAHKRKGCIVGFLGNDGKKLGFWVARSVR